MKKCLIVVLGLIGIFGVVYLFNDALCYKSAFDESINSKDYNLELENVELEIKGLSREYYFVYMTDNQANFDDRMDLGWFGTSQTRCFEDLNGISSADNFTNWIEYANSSQIDAFLMGGDIIDFCSEKNIDVLSNYLANLEMPYIYTYGNHDSYIPWENRFDDQNSEFLQLFKENNCEFQVIDIGELYVVSIRNYQTDGIAQISKVALEAFKKIIQEDKPIILMCHVPVCTDETGALKNMAQEHQGSLVVNYDAGEFGIVNKSVLMGEDCGYELTEETKEFLEILVSSECPVEMVLSGHLHESWQGYINDEIYQYIGAGAFTNQGALIHISGKKN